MKVAVAGLGNMGHRIIPAICGSPHVEGVIGFDPSADARAAAQTAFSIPTVGSYGKILRDPEIKLIFVTAPNHLHHSLTIQALEASKAVLCEKPMATDLAQSEEMVACAERLGGFLQIGFELRYSQLYVMAKEWIAAGLVGSVVNTHCTYICSEFIGRNSWRTRESDAGGMFGEKLCHYVDLPRWWIESPVVEVRSVCAPNVVPYYEIRDNYHTTCRYANGAVSQLSFMMAFATTAQFDPLQNNSTAFNDDGHELRFLIQGTRGAIETNVYGRRLRRWEFSDAESGLKSKMVEDLTWNPERSEDHRYFHNTSDQALDVIARVKAGRPPFTNPRDSLETMRLVFAAEQSAGTGRAVHLESPDVSIAA